MSLDEELAGMTCRQVLEALSDYLDGELSAEVRQRVEGHVGVCSRCERFGGVFAQIVRGIRTSVEQSDETRAFERLRRRLESA